MDSTGMGCDVWTTGILCAWTYAMSIKQVDVPESSKALDSIEVDPYEKLTSSSKPPDDLIEL
jgi:hypothetical protein